MTTSFTRSLGLLLTLGAIGCGSSSGKGDGGHDAGPPLALNVPDTCNPLRGNEPLDCATPWPSSTYEAASTATASGWQVQFPEGVLPANHGRIPVSPARINLQDGFSPAAPLVVHLNSTVADGGIDSTRLPGWQNLAASLDPASTTQILDANGVRQLQFSELDVTNAPPRQAMLIRPMTRLLPKSAYVGVVLKTLLDTAGNALPQPPGMAALVSGQPTDNARLEALRPEYTSVVLPALHKAGLDPSQVLLAWSFHTGSDEQLTSHLLSMRDAALTQVGDGTQVNYTLSEIDLTDGGAPTDGGLKPVYARLVGTFEVPLFLTDAGGPNGVMELDGGVPVQQGSYSVLFAALVPTAILTATPQNPVPVIVFGHGLLGDAVNYSTNPVLADAAERNGMLMVMTNWTGLSAADVDTVTAAIDDINALPTVTDKIQQAVINAMVELRFARGALAKDAHLQPNGQNVIDPVNAYYYGISLGGIMGDTFMAYDPDVINGVLNVPGGCWSLLLQRSTDWGPLADIFQASYTDGISQMVLSSYLQSLFDYADPITTAPYVLNAPLRGVPVKHLLMQEGRYDLQVSNLATELTARTLGIPLMQPTDDSPYGLTPMSAPLESALTIYDLMPTDEPNVTNALNTGDNGVHDGVYPTGAAQRQVSAFLKPNGTAIAPCSGTMGCVCAAPANACE